MDFSRRAIVSGLAGLGALALAGCRGMGPGQLAPAPVPSAWPKVPNAGWDAWVAGFRSRALSRDISERTLAAAFRGAGYIPAVIERDRNQFQARRSLEDYLAIATSAERLSMGRAALARQGRTLAQIEARYGVPARLVAAIWGVESRFGTRRGEVPVVSALSTLAYDGRRGKFFESQLIAALKILAEDPATRRCLARAHGGQLGRCHGAHTVHPHHLQCLCGGFQR